MKDWGGFMHTGEATDRQPKFLTDSIDYNFIKRFLRNPLSSLIPHP